MKLAHSIRVNVFSYEEEDSERILDSFLKLFPFSLEEEKISLNRINAKGFNEKNILIFEAVLGKDRHISQFIENLAGKLDDKQKEYILNQLGVRLDDNMDFFLRFDKDKWINGKELTLTDSGDCFHIKISIAAFPARRGVALAVLKEIFKIEL